MATPEGEQGLSDHYFDVNCTICAKKKRVKEAVRYCTDCRKNLCYDCVKIHNDYNEGHTLVDGHGDDAEVNLLTEKCHKHKDKLIKLFCVDHDVLVCSVCALLEHRKCDEINHITDSIEYLNKDQNVHDVPEQLKTALQNVDQAITALEQHTEELSQREHKFLKEIEEYTKEILTKIETLQKNARKEISSKHEQAASEADKKRAVCVTAKTDIIKCMDDMTSVGNREAHLFVLKKKGQSMKKNVETLCRESEDIIKRVKSIFKPDWRIKDTLNEFISLVTEGETITVALKAKIDVSVKDESRSCDIEGCCLLPDGTVLLTDNNNKRVKHVDTSNTTIKGHCGLDCVLKGVTYIGRHEVAVCTGSTSMPVVSLGNSRMMRTSTIQLNHKCSRIAQSNGELFTTYCNCVYVHNQTGTLLSVDVHDLTGTLLRTISQNESRENMFSSSIFGIVLNQSGDMVYVADYNKGLICTDRAGQEVFRRSDEDLGLSGAWGVCTSQGGNVLVCGYRSNNVVQVSEDGWVIGEILSKTDGIEKPQCLCYDEDRHILYVGGDTSTLLMYQLA